MINSAFQLLYPSFSMRVLLSCILTAPLAGTAQSFLSAESNEVILLDGRVQGVSLSPADSGTRNLMLGDSWILAALPGANQTTQSFVSFEQPPQGWWMIEGGPGYYTILSLSHKNPIRPSIWSGIPVRKGESLHGLRLNCEWDFALTKETAWDESPAESYCQFFQARGTSVTHVGFKLAHDGVDGAGPLGVDIEVSVHALPDIFGDADPDSWEQVGPSRIASNVDAGGIKFQSSTVGWNSGEIPLTPGRFYAVKLTPKDLDSGIQTYLTTPQISSKPPKAWKLPQGSEKWEPLSHNLWIVVDGDGDGLLIPYNKQSNRQFQDFAGFASSWSQPFVAQGSSLAGVVLYAAVGGSQPPIYRQKTQVTVHEGAPDGPIVGGVKIATGVGEYSGDASWGGFGAVYAPGEVPLQSGKTYWVDWQSLENKFTIGDFVNSKGIRSNGVVGFNPYLDHKNANSDAPNSNSFPGLKNGREPASGSLDAIIVTYDEEVQPAGYLETQENEPYWRVSLERIADPSSLLGSLRLAPFNLVKPINEESDRMPWSPFTVKGETHQSGELRMLEGGQSTWCLTLHDNGRFGKGGAVIDGGWAYTASGLDSLKSYIFTGWIRSSYRTGRKTKVQYGWDESGQAENPDSVTIEWHSMFEADGLWIPFQSKPLRPVEDKISLWLRGSSDGTIPFHFQTEFADLQMRQVEYRVR